MDPALAAAQRAAHRRDALLARFEGAGEGSRRAAAGLSTWLGEPEGAEAEYEEPEET
jgi:hypothetical protein